MRKVPWAQTHAEKRHRPADRGGVGGDLDAVAVPARAGKVRRSSEPQPLSSAGEHDVAQGDPPRALPLRWHAQLGLERETSLYN